MKAGQLLGRGGLGGSRPGKAQTGYNVLDLLEFNYIKYALIKYITHPYVSLENNNS